MASWLSVAAIASLVGVSACAATATVGMTETIRNIGGMWVSQGDRSTYQEKKTVAAHPYEMGHAAIMPSILCLKEDRRHAYRYRPCLDAESETGAASFLMSYVKPTRQSS